MYISVYLFGLKTIFRFEIKSSFAYVHCISVKNYFFCYIGALLGPWDYIPAVVICVFMDPDTTMYRCTLFVCKILGNLKSAEKN